MSAELELQRALYDALTALGLTVYDYAPQSRDGAALTDYPYVEIGYIVASEWDTQTENGFDVVVRIHTWSRAAGMSEIRTLQGQIYDRLHNGALTITGQQRITLMREMSDCTRASDGSFHGVCEYRTLLVTA